MILFKFTLALCAVAQLITLISKSDESSVFLENKTKIRM